MPCLQEQFQSAIRYAEGLIHTNTIEGFWSLVKWALYGQHHYYSKEHAGAYIIESCDKYNIRKNPDPFGDFIRRGGVSMSDCVQAIALARFGLQIR